jgi:transcriptional regulator with XRE-family HTH domain
VSDANIDAAFVTERKTMLTSTLRDGLDSYAIGPKLRELRLKKKMGLVELGQHTSLSPAMLSKIERGRLFPTLPTLLRIALVFGVGLDYFFMGLARSPSSASSGGASGCAFPTSRAAVRRHSISSHWISRRWNGR